MSAANLDTMKEHTVAESPEIEADDEEHFPWSYTEIGCKCACGLWLPGDSEVCKASLRYARGER